jgi:hypothetical protein
VNVTLPAGSNTRIALPAGATGDALELRLNMTVGRSVGLGPVGVSVRATADAAGMNMSAEQTMIVYSANGASGAGLSLQGVSHDPGAWRQSFAAPPLDDHLASAEHAFSLRVFVDRSVIEAHVDARLSATARAYPSSLEATHAYLVNQADRSVVVDSIEVFGMRSIWGR